MSDGDATVSAAAADPLAALTEQLGTVDDLPIEQRPAVFEQVNRALVAELDALED